MVLNMITKKANNRLSRKLIEIWHALCNSQQGIKVQDNFCNEKTSKRENIKAK